MLVDDSADQIDLMLLALRSMQLDRPVATFFSGEDCVAAIESGRVVPDLVLLDVNMPGLDGPATATRLRGLPAARNASIVMMSTSDLLSDVERALEAGANSYVLKPMAERTWGQVLAAVTGYWYDTDIGWQL
ncbi:response regulator [Roseateles sp.]|uniref:response regulator n=1 Tax=Roseateles sp. TaxID=1971397 RepID=UPI004036D4C2